MTTLEVPPVVIEWLIEENARLTEENGLLRILLAMADGDKHE